MLKTSDLGRRYFSDWSPWPRWQFAPASRQANQGAQRQMPPSGGGWGVLGAVSVLLLVLASVSSGGLRVAFVATGFTGLLVLRLVAMHGGWMRRGSVLRREPAESPYRAGEPEYEMSGAGGRP